jgi:hypothetical protein
MAELQKALSGGRADHPGPDDDDRGRCDGGPVEDLLHEISSGADAGGCRVDGNACGQFRAPMPADVHPDGDVTAREPV